MEKKTQIPDVSFMLGKTEWRVCLSYGARMRSEPGTPRGTSLPQCRPFWASHQDDCCLSLLTESREQGLTEVRRELFLYSTLKARSLISNLQGRQQKKNWARAGARKEEGLPTGRPDLLTGSRECHSLNISPINWVNNPYSHGKDFVKSRKCKSGLMDTMGPGIQVFIVPATFKSGLKTRWEWREERVFLILSSTAWMVHQQMDKQTVVHLYNRIRFNSKNK